MQRQVVPATGQFATWAVVLLLAGLSLTISLALIPIVSPSIRRRYVRFVQTTTAGTGRTAPIDRPTVDRETPTVASPGDPSPNRRAVRRPSSHRCPRCSARSYLLAGLMFGLWNGGVIAATFLLGGLVSDPFAPLVAVSCGSDPELPTAVRSSSYRSTVAGVIRR